MAKRSDSIPSMAALYSNASVLVSLNPITVPGTARYIGVGLTGYEQIAAVVWNIYACASFDRTA